MKRNKEKKMNTAKLSSLEKGATAVISGYADGHQECRSKLLSLGMTRGTKISIVTKAPLGDTLEISLRGFYLTLRKAEASIVDVVPIRTGGVE